MKVNCKTSEFILDGKKYLIEYSLYQKQVECEECEYGYCIGIAEEQENYVSDCFTADEKFAEKVFEKIYVNNVAIEHLDEIIDDFTYLHEFYKDDVLLS